MTTRKLRESHETTPKLTPQIQELQERVNCMNDSAEFQDIQSICSGKLSHVPCHPASVPSLRFVLSRDQSLPLDTWNVSGTQEMFLAIHVTCSIHHRHRIKEFFTLRTEVPQVENSVQKSTGRLVAKGEERIGSTTPMPMSAGRPSTMTFYLPAEIPQNSLAVPQRLQISELQFDDSLHLQSLHVRR